MIRSERGELVAYVHVDLNEGTDVATYVRHAQRELDRAPERKRAPRSSRTSGSSGRGNTSSWPRGKRA